MARRPDWTRRLRFNRNAETGEVRRLAYDIHTRRQYVDGRGYDWVTVVRVWDPARGDTWEEAGEAAPAGEQFGLVCTPEEFERATCGVEDLTAEERRTVCLTRQEARDALTRRAGAVRRVRFVRRAGGGVRAMRFRYDPEQRSSVPDPLAKGLLPVFDLDKRAARFVNLDGVLRP